MYISVDTNTNGHMQKCLNLCVCWHACIFRYLRACDVGVTAWGPAHLPNPRIALRTAPLPLAQLLRLFTPTRHAIRSLLNSSTCVSAETQHNRHK